MVTPALHDAIRRRAFLGGAVAAFCAAAARPARAQTPFFERHGLPVGLQLITVYPELKADLGGTLAKISKIGYRTVELPGGLDRSPTELRAALDRAGLRATNIHLGGRPLLFPPSLDGDLGKIADDCRTLGCDTIIAPSFYAPSRLEIGNLTAENWQSTLARLSQAMTLDDWKWNAGYLNKKAAGLRTHGIKLGFHNNNSVFATIGKRSIFDVLLSETDPALVSFELDVAWVASAGQDPIALLTRHPGRFCALHVKDIAATTKPNFDYRYDPAEIGQGVIDWKALLPAAYRAGVRRYFVEQEPPFVHPVFDSITMSHDYLSRLVTA
jgi:sugar phosphate isomerase/epimerase